MNFHPLGSAALLINFKQKISREVNASVLQLTAYLKKRKIEGVLFYIPAYCSLTIGYDPQKWNFNDLKDRIIRLTDKVASEPGKTSGRHWKIPVCYDDEFALDLRDLAHEKNVTPSQIITWHLSKSYDVYMLGFLPGFAYLGDLLPALQCQRKEQPRLFVPALSVAIAGAQTGIYPSSGPGGWQIIGKTPVRTFYPESENPFLFDLGDRVTFRKIAKDEFAAMCNQDQLTNRKNCLTDE